MGSTGKGLELFQSDMSQVMTDVEGGTALWEWNNYIMNIALGLHDHTLLCCHSADSRELLCHSSCIAKLAACKKAKLTTIRATQLKTAFYAP